MSALPGYGVMGFPMPGGTPPFFPKPQGGIMDRIGGLLGGGQTYGGLLSPEDQKAAQQQAMLAMGANLLQAGGPSTQKVGLGQALGGSILAGQQASRQASEGALQAMLLKSQIEKAKKGDDPSSVREYEYAKKSGFPGTFQDWIIAGGQSSRPSAVQEWEFYNSLPPDRKREYLEMKRNPNFVVKDIGQVPTVVAPSVVAGTSTTPLSTLGNEAAAASTIESAKAGGKTTGEAVATARMDLPGAIDKGNETLGLIEKLRNHPGRAIGTGASRMLQTQRVPGTPAYDFDVLRSQVSGQQFLQAYETLKGGGQITEVEGQEAKNAIARMDAAQSDDAYLDALDDFEAIIRKGMSRAQRKAAGGMGESGGNVQPTQTAPKRSREEILKKYGL